MTQRRALLIGRDHGLAWPLPQMLTRAGFKVDAISSSRIMSRIKFINKYTFVPLHKPLCPAILQSLKQSYDWVIVIEDHVLSEIVHSDLSVEDKLKVLPIQSEKKFSHLHSKIGLSQILSAHAVLTPSFRIARGKQEAIDAASTIEYPVLVKVDASSGGGGIYPCESAADFSKIREEIFHFPLLIQKKISGIELDLSALYLKGELVHFSYAKIEKVSTPFGPSILRTYYPLSFASESIFQELSRIGKALDIHGFTNTGCIQTEEGKRFYFEVDVRPNGWVETPRFFGDDPAVRIQKWFSSGQTLCYPAAPIPGEASHILIPHFLRLTKQELLSNRYRVWKFIPKDDLKFTLLLLRRFFFSFGIRHALIVTIKRIIPAKHHHRLKQIKHWFYTKTT